MHIYKFRISILYIPVLILLTTLYSEGKANQKVAFVSSLNSSIQDTVIVNKYLKFSKDFKNNQPDSSLIYAKKAKELSLKIDYKLGNANASILIGNAETNFGKLDEGLRNFTEALQLCEELLSSTNDKLEQQKILDLKAKCYSNFGFIHIRQSNYPEASKDYNAALKIREELGDKKNIAACYDNIGNIFANQGQFDDASKNYSLSLKLSEEINNQEGIGNSYNSIGNIFNYKGDLINALEYYNKSLKIRLSLSNKKLIADCYNNIGGVYFKQGAYPEALKHFFLTLKFREELKDKNGLASCYGNIGLIYSYQGNLKEALENMETSLKLCEETGYKYGIASSYSNIGTIYYRQGNYDEALKNHFNSLKIKESIGDKQGITLAYNNIGIAYQKSGKYDDALKNYLKGLSNSEAMNDKINTSSLLTNIGTVYTQSKNFKKAYDYINKGLNIAKEVGNKDGLQVSYNAMAVLDSSKGDFKNALINYQYYVLYRDSMFNEENTKKTVQSQLQYKYEKEQDSIKSENSKRELNLQKELELKQLHFEYERKQAQAKSEKEKQKLIFEESLKRKSIEFEFDKKQAQLKYEDEINRKKLEFNYQQRQAKIEQEQKQREIMAKSEQEKKDALAKKEIEKQRFVRNSFVVGFILVMFIAIGIFRNLQQNRRAKEIITKQKIEVEEKNREILDSIEYAKRLQNAILPANKLVKEYLVDSFIFYKPKDIVAGDFYWFYPTKNEKNQTIILFAAADCTGHGVPGAMVSVVCANALNKAVKELNLLEPSKILDTVNRFVEETFIKKDEDEVVQDGMDISLCALNLDTLQLQWSGANNPLILISNTETITHGAEEPQLIELKPDKQPIGLYSDRKPFTNHTLQLQKGNVLYLFSDGFADQFGGSDGKKLMKKNLKNHLLNISIMPIEKQLTALENYFNSWKGVHPQVDDVCVIGVRI